LQLAFACALLWAGFCLFLAVGYEDFDAAVLLYLGSPLAALVGVGLADARANRLYAMPTSSAWTSFEIELKARYVLHACQWAGHPTAEREIPKAAADAPAAAAPDNDGRDDDSAVLIVKPGSEETPPTQQRRQGGAVLGRPPNRRGGAAVPTTTSPNAASLREEDQDNVAARSRIMRSLLTTDNLASIEGVFTEGAAIFTGAPLLHIATARFYGVLSDSRHLLLTHLLRAARLHPGLDAEVFAAEVSETR
jgi:hypothetical protein